MTASKTKKNTSKTKRSIKTLARNIRDILARHDTKEAALPAIEQTLAKALADGALLSEDHKTSCPDGYKRHLLHVNKETPFTILCLVWRPGQSSPVHGHKAWCVVGMAEGELTVESYKPSDPGGLTCHEQVTVSAGDTCIERPQNNDIHRLANNSDKKAVSLHIYGMDLSSEPQKINTPYDEATA